MMAGSRHESVDDLASLPELEESTLLDAIQTRYDEEKIYTYIGDILVALNPYGPLPIYGGEKWQLYKEVSVRGSLPPHIYVISDSAYQNMKFNHVDQCCVVSGESGAGKTESTKLLIEHIAQLCRHDNSDLHSRIVQVNPLLEAFGNAQTVINNNSSRFGKFIELVFDQEGQILGAKISEYLLEKSRVVLQSPGEKNFHIFYYLFAGLEPAELEANLLNRPDEHRIMKSGYDEPVYADKNQQRESKAMWSSLLNIMKSVGFKDEEFDGILAVLAAILHITDIQFVEDPETDGVFIQNEQLPAIAAQLLVVRAEDLVSALISSVSTAGSSGEKILSLKNLSQASDGRDALAKALYGRLFGWIVRQINVMLEPRSAAQQQRAGVTIGILDIYGFENLQLNSFEQLCINVANEQLQYYFNLHIFKSELEEYEREGVPATSIAFVDNQPLIELFLGSSGILSRLDDESKFPQGNDQSFVDKLTQDLSRRPEFQTQKGQRPEFMIIHFAGVVTYHVLGFVEKNRDNLGESMNLCMKNSDSRFIAELFSPVSELGALELNPGLTLRRKEWRMSKMLGVGGVGETPAPPPVDSNGLLKRASVLIREGRGGSTNQSPTLRRTTARQTTLSVDGSKGGTRTLASHFKNSLADLLQKLTRAQPHFIRCIKPNALKAPQMFDSKLVLQQLRYTGVLETVKIRKQGYSVRLTFADFVERYKIISFSTNPKLDRETCTAMLRSNGLKDWQMGKTKVFLKYYHMEKLNELASSVRRRVTGCQAHWRAALARRELFRLQEEARLVAEELARAAAEVAEAAERLYEQQSRLCVEDENIYQTEQAQTKIYEKVTSGMTTTLDTIHAPHDRTQSFTTHTPSMPTIQEWQNPPGFYPPSDDPSTIQVLLDETTIKLNGLSTEIWGKVYYMEKNAIMGKVYLRDWDIIMDDSNQPYDGQVIGINTFDHCGDAESDQALDHIGQGVKIMRDDDGNIWVTKLTRSDIFIKGFNEPERNCFSSDVTSTGGRLSYDPIKIFDVAVYKKRVAAELQRVDFDPHLFNRLSVIKLSFWRDRLNDVETPCWICVVNFVALDLLGKEYVFNELRPSLIKLKSKDESKVLEGTPAIKTQLQQFQQGRKRPHTCFQQKWLQLDYRRQQEGIGVGLPSHKF